MTEAQVRQYLGEILPALAEMADRAEAPDLGEAAFVLRAMAHKVGLALEPAPTVVHLVS
jgi:hypothetical protein